MLPAQPALLAGVPAASATLFVMTATIFPSSAILPDIDDDDFSVAGNALIIASMPKITACRTDGAGYDACARAMSRVSG